MSDNTDEILLKIQKQLEFYFSESNLSKSKYMQSEIDDEGYLCLEKIKSFNLMKLYSLEQIISAAKLSPLLVVSEDHLKIRSGNKPVKVNPKSELLTKRTIFVDNLSPEDNRDTLRNLFEHFGEITYISIPNKIQGCGFVEFQSETSAINAAKKFRHSTMKATSKQSWLTTNIYLKLQSDEKNRVNFKRKKNKKIEKIFKIKKI